MNRTTFNSGDRTMTTDTSKAPERKYSKPSDVYGADLSNVTESPEVIWLTFSEGELSWTDRRTDDEDIPYVRADIHAAMQARAERAEAALIRQAGAAKTLRQITLDEVKSLKEMDRSEYFASDALEGEKELNSILTEELEALRAESERLREALSDLVDYTELATGECDLPDGQDPLSRARAALEKDSK